MGECVQEQRVLRGGSAGAIQRTLDEWNASRILLVTGRDSYALSGAKDFIAPVLQGRTSENFCLSVANPSVPDLLLGLKKVRDLKPHCFIAVGGGSVMDMAKLLNVFSQDGDASDDFFNIPETFCPMETAPLIAIPTTAGSGSEATGFAVLYDGDRKHSVESPLMRPDVVVLSPDLTSSLPPYQTACSGFDALAQAVESFWAVGATAASRQLSGEAIDGCLENLEAAVIHPSAKNRNGMMEAAYLAGKAIGITKTTAAHALSYFLTSHYGLPHGHAVALLLPAVFRMNSELLQNPDCVAGSRRAVLEELCKRLGSSSVSEAAEKIEQLATRIGLTKDWVAQHRVDPDEMCDLVVRNVNKNRLKNNLVELDHEALSRIVAVLRA